MRSPASSHTARNPMMTMMLFRLLRAIWWYIYPYPAWPFGLLTVSFTRSVT